MVRRGTLKLYQYGAETPVMYDLATDPAERVDLWGSDVVPSAVQRELATLAWADGWSAAAVADRVAKLDADVAIITQWGRVAGRVGEHAWGPDAALVEAVSRL